MQNDLPDVQYSCHFNWNEFQRNGGPGLRATSTVWKTSLSKRLSGHGMKKSIWNYGGHTPGEITQSCLLNLRFARD